MTQSWRNRKYISSRRIIILSVGAITFWTCLNRGGSRNNLQCFPDFKMDLHEGNINRNTGAKKKITFSNQESKQKTDKNLSVKNAAG